MFPNQPPDRELGAGKPSLVYPRIKERTLPVCKKGNVPKPVIYDTIFDEIVKEY